MTFEQKRKKPLSSVLLIILTAVILLFPLTAAHAEDGRAGAAEDDQMRGIWLSFKDYAELGLSVSIEEDAYRENVDRFLDEASKYSINTVFLHVRAFNDAFWRSRSFNASKYIGGDEILTAWEAYDRYDPLGVFLEEAHRYGVEVHAWLNPYRVSEDYYYDPADEDSTEIILMAVRELLEFRSSGEKIDGIHLDDYFYNAPVGYYKPRTPYDRYAIVSSENERPSSGRYLVVTPDEKRENINRMVRKVYQLVSHADRTFGISPPGNYDNAMNSGADIDTWLSEEGYVDYVMPQIYWTNQWGGGTTMFSDRLDLFLEKRNNRAKFYVGLALYKTGTYDAGDPGWSRKDTNLIEQINELEDKGADGYVFFSAQHLFKDFAAGELSRLTK
ncbi:MAG: family 10 glycosylhydrolase [Eubacteriales bacterium]|nr:family 10 glycosylhydrolase [Eubacteriales bacterium]